MTKNYFTRAALVAGLAGGTLLSLLFSGCETDGSVWIRGNRGYHNGSVQATVVFEDDYDYYPGYEIYYSRNRHEYVYLDGNSWVRRPEPIGVTLNVLLAAPSVRVDFRDSPEHHHASVIKSYPRNWHQAAPAQSGKNAVQVDSRSEKKREDDKKKHDKKKHDKKNDRDNNGRDDDDRNNSDDHRRN